MRDTSSFNKSFWVSTIATLVACLMALHLVAERIGRSGPVKPPFPFPGEAYVSSTGRDVTDHDLFRYNIFGFGQRIHDADLLIIGSSHPEFGLSARQLSRELSTYAGRPIKVFNMGMPDGDGVPFAEHVLQSNGVIGKTVIIDLFSGVDNGLSPHAREVEQSGPVAGFFRVADVWAGFAREWLLDGLLPRLITDPPARGIRFARFLQTLTTLRDWNTGDLVDVVWPGAISRYADPPPGSTCALRFPARPNAPGYVQLSPSSRDFLSARGFRTILTLLPYQDYDPQLGSTAAAEAGEPYVPIAPDELRYWDRLHLTAAGRKLATDRLVDALPPLMGLSPAAQTLRDRPPWRTLANEAGAPQQSTAPSAAADDLSCPP